MGSYKKKSEFGGNTLFRHSYGGNKVYGVMKSYPIMRTFCDVLRIYFSFLQNYTHNPFWFLGDTQGARFYDMHGTTLHLFVMLFPVQYMEKRFALETRELFDKK